MADMAQDAGSSDDEGSMPAHSEFLEPGEIPEEGPPKPSPSSSQAHTMHAESAGAYGVASPGRNAYINRPGVHHAASPDEWIEEDSLSPSRMQDRPALAGPRSPVGRGSRVALPGSKPTTTNNGVPDARRDPHWTSTQGPPALMRAPVRHAYQRFTPAPVRNRSTSPPPTRSPEEPWRSPGHVYRAAYERYSPGGDAAVLPAGPGASSRLRTAPGPHGEHEVTGMWQRSREATASDQWRHPQQQELHMYQPLPCQACGFQPYPDGPGLVQDPRHDVPRLQYDEGELERDNTELAMQVEGLEEQLRRALRDVEEVRAQRQQLLQERREADELLHGQAEELGEAEAQLREQEGALTEAVQAVEQQKQRVAELQEEAAGARAQLTALEKALAGESERREAEASNASARQVLLGSLKAENAQLQSKLAKLNGELDAVRDERRDLQKETGSLQAEMREMEAEAVRLRQDNSALKNELAALRRQLASTVASLDAARMEGSSLRRQLQDLASRSLSLTAWPAAPEQLPRSSPGRQKLPANRGRNAGHPSNPQPSAAPLDMPPPPAGSPSASASPASPPSHNSPPQQAAWDAKGFRYRRRAPQDRGDGEEQVCVVGERSEEEEDGGGEELLLPPPDKATEGLAVQQWQGLELGLGRGAGSPWGVPYGTEETQRELQLRTAPLEAQLQSMNLEKQALEAEYNRMPVHGGRTISQQRRKQQVEQRLDELERIIPRINSRIRSFVLS